MFTTPTPAPAGRLARGEQRKDEEGGVSDRVSSRSPCRLIWNEGEGEGEGEGEWEGGPDGREGED